MGGIETQRADVTKRANIPSAIGGAERIAAILDDPEVIFLRDPHHLAQIEGVAERVGDHNGARPVGHRGLDRVGLDIVGRDIDVDEYRRSEEHTSELQSLMRISYTVFCWNKKKNTLTRYD